MTCGIKVKKKSEDCDNDGGSVTRVAEAERQILPFFCDILTLAEGEGEPCYNNA